MPLWPVHGPGRLPFPAIPGQFPGFFHAESVQADDSHVVLLGGVAGSGGAKIPVLPFPGFRFREVLALAELVPRFSEFHGSPRKSRQGGFSGVFIRQAHVFFHSVGSQPVQVGQSPVSVGAAQIRRFLEELQRVRVFLWDMANTALARKRSALMNS